jgi:two-component system sensor histidine kinase KdpD
MNIASGPQRMINERAEDSPPTAEEPQDQRQHVERRPTRAWLRIYLGYAPGVGKTYAMLHEGRRRRERGTDVVVGWVDTHDRPRTAEAIGDLEVIPRRQLPYRGIILEEMDVGAILTRRPQVTLIDELAHTNAPGSAHFKRYQDVLQLRDAGINVITTVNVQHLESLQNTIEQITGVRVQETLPDRVLEAADEVELVDVSPEALQKRLLHGNIYPPPRVDEALAHFFRKGNLAALRELALRRVLEHTDVQRQAARRSDGVAAPWPSPEVVLVCLPPTEQAQHLIRRGAHLSARLQARFYVLHVARPAASLDARGAGGQRELAKAMQLARELGAQVVTRQSSRVGDAIVAYAKDVGATQIVLGESNRSWLREVLKGSITRQVLRGTQDVDVHIVPPGEGR